MPAALPLMPRLISRCLVPCLALCGLLLAGGARAEPLAEILSSGEQSAAAGQAAQAEVDRLATATRALLEEYKSVSRQIEGLGIHNARLERLHEDQQRRLAELELASAGALALQREIAPLLTRMIDSLEQFISLDLPFRLAERNARIVALRRGMESADTPVDMSFRDVLLAYRAELDYARHLGTYADTISVDGAAVGVQVLQVGRSVLLAQTPDATRGFRWDPSARGWVTLDDSYLEAVTQGVAIARGDQPPVLLRLPLPAPAEAGP